MKPNGFIIALITAIFLAYLAPTALEHLPVQIVIDIGVAFIFFFYGLKLSPAELKLGFFNYKSHILIHLTTFVIFPLLTMLFIPFFDGGTDSKLWLAIFFLGALPSTVTSAVVMVAIARGNLPTAIFNASISGLIGIVVTPLWMSLFMMKSGEFNFLEIITDLLIQIVLPLFLGVILQRFLGKWANKYSKQLSLFDKAVIILIVFTSFSHSFNSNLFDNIEWTDLLKLFAIVIFLFFSVYFLTGYLCKLFKFNLQDTITAKFCGTKKSLVHGSIMVKIIFGTSPNVGLFLLPIMLYHIFQLVLVSFFAQNYSKKVLKEMAD
ncbi:solute carrier family 10 (sodium/bile acid cotransporter), member 7 [Gillisia sp. Hel1_33_143]|uniref:bile acid:sodium symporter family protein n=1 Tax=Gillisia sp. Hel1_33_143 TaxID=1336796 RepID=UPI00087AE496|nr:bile acid:sodium symporter family protein [Gillisia sp. Hel1_33_143]SDS48993.1 solute carrier family 10 (sodium/bile acid cotransporter), member 7 [Gillisia sp. Hel1_33_143]